MKDIKESEVRALSEAKALQTALSEHSLELRVRAANEAELACQQRLAAAEAEKNELWEKLDAADRYKILSREKLIFHVSNLFLSFIVFFSFLFFLLTLLLRFMRVEILLVISQLSFDI